MLALTIDRLVQQPPQSWGEEMKTDLTYAIRHRYTKLNSRVPPAVSLAMFLMELFELPESALARKVHEFGPRATMTLEACKDMLASVETKHFSYGSVATALLFMAITEGGDRYNAGVFVQGLRQHRAGSKIDWSDVLSAFDKDGLRIQKKQFMILYNALVPLAREYANFDIQNLWGGSWQFQDTQLSFVVAFLSTTPEELDVTQIPNLRQAFTLDDFDDASDNVRSFAVEAVKHPLVSRDATEGLFTMIFRSQETYNQAQMLGIPETIINPNMTIFVCAASAVPKPWAALQEQALKQLFYPFLLKQHPNYDSVMHALWRNDKLWVAGRMVEFYTQEHMLLTLIFEHAQEHGWLEGLLTISSSFAVDLATYAHGRGACDLEEWAQQHVAAMGLQAFARAIVDFLKQKMEDEIAVQKDHIAPSSPPLTIRTVHKLVSMISDALPEEEMALIQRQSLNVYPRLINYGEDEDRDAILEANAERSNALPDEAGAQMEEQYKRMYGGQTDANGIINELKQLKVSASGVDQDLFASMVHGLFDEYNCFGEYPPEALATTAVLFGGIIKYDVVSGLSAQVALSMVFDAVALYTPEDSMWKFGMQALIHFQDRLKDYPQLLERTLHIPSLRGTQIIAPAEKMMKELQENEISMNGDAPNGLTNGVLDDEFPVDSPTPAFSAIHIDPPVRPGEYETPDEDVSDKVMFVLNNVSKRNLDDKFKDLEGALEERHHQWFARYLVEELAKSQPNFQGLYLQLLDNFNEKLLWAEVLRETYISCSKMLNAQTTMDSTSERTNLKNLAGWLGSLTLARNQPILHRNLSFKDLLLEAYDTQRLLVAIPFTCKVLVHAAHSKIFKPPNPWLMELLGFLSELYHCMELKLNLKFEIEVLCKDLNTDIMKIEPLDVVRSRPALLHENNMLQQYMPDSAPEGFGDMHVLGLSKRPASERFTPEAVIQALPNLGEVLNIPQPTGPNTSQSQLRNIFISAAQQAIYEIIAPVVERSVTIAAISTAELIQKDFAAESDTEKLRNSAHTMVKSLSGSLALVTCKEPLRMSIMNNIRIYASRNLAEPLAEGQILMFVNDNIDTVCNLVERAAEEHSIAEADAQLAQAMDQRRQHNEQRPGEPFNNPPVSHWAKLIPDPYKQEQGGLNRRQLDLYDDFGRQVRATPAAHATNNASIDATSRQIPDVLSDTFLPNLPTPAEAPVMPRATPQQRMQAMQMPQNQHQVNGYVDAANIGQTIRSLLDGLQHACREASEEHIVEVGEATSIRRIFEELVALIDSSVQKDTFALAAGQEVLIRMYSDTHRRLELEVFVRFLMHLCRISTMTLKELTTWLAISEEDRLFNAPATVALMTERLLEVENVDLKVAKAIRARRPLVLGFLKDLVEEVLVSDSAVGALRADFILTYEALSQWLAEDPSLELGREIMSKLQMPANQPNGLPSPPGSEKHDQLEYIFEEWIRLQRKDASERSQIAFVQQLHQRHIVGSPEEAIKFFRSCLEMCASAYDRATTTPFTPVEAAHIFTDALAKLIAILVLNQTPIDGQNEPDVPKYFSAILYVVLLVFNDQYVKLRERFPARVYFRLLSSLLCEFHAARDQMDDQVRKSIQQVFVDAFMVTQPKAFEVFSFCWLSLISHRLFLPVLLKGQARSTGGWDAYTKLLGCLFSYVGFAAVELDTSLALQEFYRGVTRLMLLLHRDFPDFLIEKHAELNAAVPAQINQLHNIINSAATAAAVLDQPDPFQRGLKINRLEQVRQSPAVHTDLEKILRDAGILEPVQRALSGPEIREDDFKAIISALSPEEKPIDVLLVNALLVYIGVKATAASSVFSAAAAPARLMERLSRIPNAEARFHVVSAMIDQLRYVNGHTQYFSTALTHMFGICSEELQKTIMSIFVQRLAIPRPHPWGLIITVLELIRNPSIDIWSLPWIKTAPQVENMLVNLAQHQERIPHSPLGALA